MKHPVHKSNPSQSLVLCTEVFSQNKGRKRAKCHNFLILVKRVMSRRYCCFQRKHHTLSCVLIGARAAAQLCTGPFFWHNVGAPTKVGLNPTKVGLG